jgi:hypothetical protein
MNYVLVPDTQPTQTIRFLKYPDQSELEGGISPNGLYPIPGNMPVETWPSETGTLTLSQWQQDVNNAGGDRHSIVVKPGAGFIWETWQAKLIGANWQSSNGAKFNLNSNALRPDGWTSGDAGGLPMFPALVRFDECQRGMVEHALRLVVKSSRQAYIYPATHYASTLTGVNYPSMGQRLRLRSSFVIPNTWTVYEKAVALALKKYGAMVADNGNFFSVSVCPDQRFPSNAFDNLSSIGVSSFDVIQSTGPLEGPRTAGAPGCDAGSDQLMEPGMTASLHGTVATTGPAPAVQWKKYSGPGTVTFGNPALANTNATFSLPGRYTLMLSASDGVHAVAYDAMVVDVRHTIDLVRSGNDMLLRFASATGRTYRVERSPNGTANTWIVLADNVAGTGALVQVTHANAVNLGRQFYHVLVLP